MAVVAQLLGSVLLVAGAWLMWSLAAALLLSGLLLLGAGALAEYHGSGG